MVISCPFTALEHGNSLSQPEGDLEYTTSTPNLDRDSFSPPNEILSQPIPQPSPAPNLATAVSPLNNIPADVAFYRASFSLSTHMSNSPRPFGSALALILAMYGASTRSQILRPLLESLRSMVAVVSIGSPISPHQSYMGIRDRGREERVERAKQRLG